MVMAFNMVTIWLDFWNKFVTMGMLFHFGKEGLWSGAVWKTGGIKEWNGSNYGMDRTSVHSISLVSNGEWWKGAEGWCGWKWALEEAISFKCRCKSESSFHEPSFNEKYFLVPVLLLLLLLLLPPPQCPHRFEGLKGRMHYLRQIYYDQGISL